MSADVILPGKQAWVWPFSRSPTRAKIAEEFIVMIAETISLGILSLPSVLAAIGIVP